MAVQNDVITRGNSEHLRRLACQQVSKPGSQHRPQVVGVVGAPTSLQRLAPAQVVYVCRVVRVGGWVGGLLLNWEPQRAGRAAVRGRVAAALVVRWMLGGEMGQLWHH